MEGELEVTAPPPGSQVCSRVQLPLTLGVPPVDRSVEMLMVSPALKLTLALVFEHVVAFAATVHEREVAAPSFMTVTVSVVFASPFDWALAEVVTVRSETVVAELKVYCPEVLVLLIESEEVALPYRQVPDGQVPELLDAGNTVVPLLFPEYCPMT